MTHQTLLRIAPAIALVALASCGASKDGNSQGGAAVENATLTKLELTSDAFKDGQPIPAQYTCDGAGQTPTLRWSEPPADTKSFALVIDDPMRRAAPFVIGACSTFRHRRARSAAANGPEPRSATTSESRATAAPARPRGTGRTIIISSCSPLMSAASAFRANSHVSDIEREADKHAMAKGELIGTYERR